MELKEIKAQTEALQELGNAAEAAAKAVERLNEALAYSTEPQFVVRGKVDDFTPDITAMDLGSIEPVQIFRGDQCYGGNLR